MRRRVFIGLISALIGPGIANAQAVRDVCFADATGFANVTVAQVGAGITSLEASTIQVLDVMSANRIEAAIVCPPGFSRSGATCIRLQAAAPRPAPQSQPAVGKSSKSPSQSARPSIGQVPTASRYRADQVEVRQPDQIRLGGWTETFADYERRSRDGRQTQRTIGAMFGIDATTKAGDGNLRVGVIGGYASTTQDTESNVTRRESIVYDMGPFAEPFSFDFDLRIPNVPNTVATDLRRHIKAINGGLTGSYAIGRFFLDAVARIESSEISQRGWQSNSAGALGGPERIFINSAGDIGPVYDANGTLISGRDSAFGCIDVRGLGNAPNDQTERARLIQERIDTLPYQPIVVSLDGEATSLSFIFANTMGVTYELGSGFIFEPTVGYRYIYTDYSRSAAALGLDDGRALRLEAGGKISNINVSRDGAVWINSVGLYAYSDVMVKGFVIASDGSAVDSDEGEIRGRAVLQSRLQMPNGVSYYGEVNGRFGDQYWGVGGKLGMRIEW